MSYVSLTSWSLHRSLGPLRMTEWDATAKTQVVKEFPQPSLITLTELPSIAASKGIRALDVCHFHFPSTSSEYLHQLRQAFDAAGVVFYTLLVDYGDVSSSDDVRRNSDIAYIQSWIDVASTVGATRVRVVAGDAASSDGEALARSTASFQSLQTYAESKGVRVITENFRSLSATPANCLHLVRECSPQLRLIADFGNFKGDGKYGDLAQILPFADNVHAKAHYDANGFPDESEFERCLRLLEPAKYNGPITIVYDGPGDEWDGIQRVQSILERAL